MASPTSSSSSSAAAASLAASAPDPPSSSAHPLPQLRPYASASLRPSPAFSPQPVLGKPLNPPPPTQGLLYHHRGAFPPRPSVRPSQAAAVMTFAAAAQARPFAYGPADSMVTQMHVPIHHLRPPPAPLVVHRPVVAPTGPIKSIQSGAHPKATPNASVSSTAEDNKFRKRERSREDDVMVINDRKTNFGDGEKLLPRPLPASMVDSEVNALHENDTESDDVKEDEHVGSIEELSMEDLLHRHVKHAKIVRARLRKERLRRIQRCKQRLALLLPPPSELGKNEITP
ncbi:uncharacterized protein LOC122043007 isoform X2 [Zingiber officinale]|uniref:uncharacterized protein LOC122043007 isoform X2 n=1 Tax=Zingiber officinale TaxID=94328 RepID=UPI001C4AB603|nr:uncharacterized protein LOC122043007 isoform X2 [Zingiber officinale]